MFFKDISHLNWAVFDANNIESKRAENENLRIVSSIKENK
jgi:hypothetical protein